MVVYINEKVHFFSLTTIMSTTKRKKYRWETKNIQIINLNIKREERIQICSAKEMGHRVVGGMAVGAGGVIGPAYGVAVGLEPLR